MNTVLSRKPATKPFILTKRIEGILEAIHFYRYLAALDVTHLLYSPSSLTYVRSLLSCLAGGADFKTNQYLYRFKLPSCANGGTRIYTLGSRGRVLARDLGLAIDWSMRPQKLKHLSYSQVDHNLTLSRFLIAAQVWAKKQSNFRISQLRICYELAREAPLVQITKDGKTEALKVIPDAWVLVEKLRGGVYKHFIPLLVELDRGTEQKEKFKQFLRSRVEFIRSGAYTKMFGTNAVVFCYVTTGDVPAYRETRRKALCRWIKEVLIEMSLENWSHIFYVTSVVFDELYTSPIFTDPLWYRPYSEYPVPLFTP